MPRQLLEGNQIGDVQLINHSFSNELFVIMIGIIFVSFLISGTERDRRIWACSRSDCKDKKKVAVDGGPSCQSLGSSSPVSQADADYCSTAGVRTNEIRRLTEWWHARTLASYYKSGWSNELIFFLPLKYYKFLSFDSTYLFIFFINLHALYLIMKKKVCRLFFLSLCVLGQIFWMECGNYDLSWPLVLNNVQVAGNP